ncbi:hypothetical protein SAY87_024412 [Trapa incisa]|uniref:STI1/HOP DP domain-containing protein n=1 Tax=Trapa incisa TaxID=236973 RepID=A0AAN7GFV6_9MYRT|nr:hypothetical protein SAY87_024412 [Trapa incisa]
MAEEAKDRGNEAFIAGRYEVAVCHYSDGIELSPDDYILYSSRYAAYAALDLNHLALRDAVKTYNLQPGWPEAYSCLAYAHLSLGLLDQAICSFKLGLEISPDNDDLKSGYEDAVSQAKKQVEPLKPHEYGNIFGFSSFWEKLEADPDTAKFASQPDFLTMMREVEDDPFNANKYSADPRLLQAIGVLLNVRFRAAKEPVPESSLAESRSKKVEEKKLQSIEEEPEYEIEVKKNYEATVRNYITEIDLEGNINELQKEKPSSALELALKLLRVPKIDYQKLPARKSKINGKRNIKEEMDNINRRTSIPTLNNKFVEVDSSEFMMHSNEQDKELANYMLQVFHSLPMGKKMEMEKEALDERALFEAVRDHHTELLKQNPNNPQAYGDRSGCHIVLRALDEALKDAEKCIELDPCFWKGYLRKGQVLYRMKEFGRAVEIYLLGLKRCQDNEELASALGRIIYQFDTDGNSE